MPYPAGSANDRRGDVMIVENARILVRDPRTVDVARAYLAAIEARDIHALRGLVGREVVLTHANYPPVTGRDEAIDMIEAYLEIIEDVEFEVLTLLGDENIVLIEKVNVAETSDGAGARIRVATILETDADGRISSIRIYADTADLFHRPDLPRSY
jgi:limonene-1,2-epoxide hydrolase